MYTMVLFYQNMTAESERRFMIYRKEEYVEENRQDDKFPVKQIEMLEPLDSEKNTKFVGHVALGMQTPMGVQQIPVSFEINAEDIKDAFDKFGDHAAPQIDSTRKQIEQEVQKIRRESSSRIVQPGDMDLQNQGNVIDFDNLK